MNRALVTGRMKHWFARLAALGLCFWWAMLTQPAHARTLLELDAKAQPASLGDWGSHWIADRTSTLEQFLNTLPEQRRPTLKTGTYPTSAANRLWIDIAIPAAPDAERWYLEVPMPGLDRITVYTPDSSGNWTSQTAGDTIAVTQWPVPNRFALMPVPVSAEAPTRIVVAIEHTQLFGAPLRFVSESHVNPREQSVALIHGVFFGLLLMALVYSLLSAAVLRDSNYVWTAVFIACVGVAQAAATGVGAATLWPNSPRWADSARVIGALAGMCSLAFLYDHFAALGSRARWIRMALYGLAASVLCGLGMWLVSDDPGGTRDRVLVPLGGISVLVATALPLLAWARGDRLAPWMAAGQLLLTVATSLPLLVFWGVIEFQPDFANTIQIALAVQLPLILIAMALRAQERRVVHQRVSDLSRVDGTSGLILPAVFHYRANLALSRAKRFHHHAALLRVELVNLEAMRKEFGRKAADAAQLALSERLLHSVRDIDSIGQLEDDVIGIVIEGPVTPQTVSKLATQIVARGLSGFAYLPQGLQLRMRVFIAQLPFNDMDAQRVQDHLRAASAANDRADPRAIYIVTPDRSIPADEFLKA